MSSDIHWFLGFLLVIGVFAYGGWSARKSGVLPGYATSTTPVMSTREAARPSERRPSETGISAELRARKAELAKLQEELARAQADRNASPLREKLSIASVRHGSGTGVNAAQNEYLVLQAARRNTAPIAITGLTVQSAVTHISAEVPKAWKLPFPGASGDGEPITLAPGAVAYLITGHSGNGTSFQLNACTGYLAQTKIFSPAIPRQCPRARDEPLPLPPNHLSDTCLDYIAALPACTVPSSIPVRLQSDGSCQAHIFNRINYDTCVSLHKDEPNFYRNDWRLYLGRAGALWRERRETIELLDPEGRLIDSYSY